MPFDSPTVQTYEHSNNSIEAAAGCTERFCQDTYFQNKTRFYFSRVSAHTSNSFAYRSNFKFAQSSDFSSSTKKIKDTFDEN